MESTSTSPESLRQITSSHDRILAAAKRLFASQGYEATSTMAIARLAGTSESQMMKHFGSKEGLLEAILDAGWRRMGEPLSAIQAEDGPAKLLAMLDIVLNTMAEDHDLKELLLLEGRRIRREGRAVILSPGYIQFVGVIDSILQNMSKAGTLRPEISPQAARSAVMGMAEGMLRDQVLSHRREFPANYSLEDQQKLFALYLKAITQKAPQPAKRPSSKTKTKVVKRGR